MTPAGQDVGLRFNITDSSGLPVTALTASFRVSGPNGVITDWAALTLPNPPTPGVILVTIPAISNQITPGAPNEARIVDLQITSTSIVGASRFTLDYVIAVDDELVLMTNSFQSYAQAVGVAHNVPDLKAWPSATTDQRKSAMSTAYYFLSRLDYEVYYDRDDVYFRNRASWGLPYINTIGRLYNYLPADFLNLDPDFIKALRTAQLIEADERLASSLGVGSIQSERDNGIVTATTGDESHTFRQTKPLSFSVSKRALTYLSGYVKFSLRVTRS